MKAAVALCILAPALGRVLRGEENPQGGLPLAAKEGPGKYEVVSREGLGDNLPYPGVDYLGMGYNMIRGNPEGDPDTQVDPGWRVPALNLEWSQDRATRDLRDLQPLGGYAVPEYACHMTQSANEESSMEDYGSSLSMDASLSVQAKAKLSPVKGSFQASGGFSKFSREIATSKSSRYVFRSYCLQFRAGLEVNAETKSRLLPSLKKRIEALPKGEATEGLNQGDELQTCAEVKGEGGKQESYCFANADMIAWTDFFDEFGTHVADEVHLGGKVVAVVTISESEKEKMSGHDIHSEVEAEVTKGFKGFGATTTVKTSHENSKDEKSSTSSMKKDTKVSVYGGLPPQDNDVMSTEGFGEWSESVREAPMPVRSSFVGLDKVSDIDPAAYHAALKLYAAKIALDPPVPFTDLPEGMLDNSTLSPSGELRQGMTLTTKSKFELKMQEDGNLCLRSPVGRILWATNSYGKSEQPYAFTLQNDCNLVIYGKADGSRSATWSPHTESNCGVPGVLKLREDGNLVLKDMNGKVKWESGTAGGKLATDNAMGNKMEM